ncbi:MAG TPA: excalibur calcium-binding domain-containing protein [Dehalococcoidia bacterium]|nr:excalibur calcium-binding domain-containing protein [Dehalococcoidia bacterium]
MKILIIALLSALVALAAVGTAGANHVGDTFNCSDFPNQAAAQAHYRQHPTDQDNLDQDKDGIACESLPCPCDNIPVGQQQPSPTPTGTATATATATATPSPTATIAAIPPTGGNPGDGGSAGLPVIALLAGSGMLALAVGSVLLFRRG